MKTKLTRANVVAIVAIAMLTVFCTASAQAVEIDWPEPGWPEIFEPNQLMTLNLEMSDADWDTIRYDLTFAIEVPAWFWMTGEEHLKIKVMVRRKSSFAFPDEADPCQVAFKIDINEYLKQYPGDPNAATDWHGLKKLSLETNEDGADVIAEGVACNLDRMASGPEGYGYDSWRANWIKLYVNGDYKGVYVNNEQHDKTFMIHRGLYIHHLTWLYKFSSEGNFVLKVGDKEEEDVGRKSPAVDALCYAPFVCSSGDPCLYPTGGECSLPNDVILAADMNEWVNMQGLLTLAAVEHFTANFDGFFTHGGRNAYFLDFNLPDPCETRKRMYFGWDMDSALFVGDGTKVDFDIYTGGGGGTMNQEVILGHPTFRSQYNQIMRDLLDGPWSFADINDFLDMVEPVISSALAADPYNQMPAPGEAGVAQHFDYIRTWFSNRIPWVLAQVDFDEPPLPPGIVLLNDGFDDGLGGAAWDANWDEIAHNWMKDTTTYAHGRPSAWADEVNDGDFTCDALDASDATAIHIGFKVKKYATDVGDDLLLYYFDGTNYDLIADLDTLGGDNEWLYYTDTITDSQYFVPNFRIRFDCTLEKRENAWVDDVVITKETPQVPPIISGYILDPNDKPIDGVLVDANNAGGSDTTDIDGYYEVEVPPNWSGTVTPTKEDYTFEPANRAYSNVTADQTGQDYVGTSIYDFNEDGFIDFADLAVCIPAWLSNQGDGNWNAACDFYADLHIDFKDFAKSAGAWKPE